MVVSKILVISANIGFTAGQIHHKYRSTNYVGKREAGFQKTFKGIIITHKFKYRYKYRFKYKYRYKYKYKYSGKHQ